MVRTGERATLQRRIANAMVVGIVALLLVMAAVLSVTTKPLVILAATALFGVPLGVWIAVRMSRSTLQSVEAVRDAAQALDEGDFSLRLPEGRGDEIGDLFEAVNQVGDVVREERTNLHQKEWMLETVLHTTPIAILLLNARERVVYSNKSARQLLSKGLRLEGRHQAEILRDAPSALRNLLAEGDDSLFKVELNGQEESFHVSQRHFQLTMKPHTLVMIRRMTPELRREEVAIWKKVIRVISHELNNSLAPIGSLAHSARLLLEKPDQAHRLDEVFDTIEERVEHLRDFLGGYARFAKLPAPVRKDVPLREFLESLGRISHYRAVGEIPEGDAYFDPSQIEQVLINLIKNAHEAAGPAEDVTLSATLKKSGGVTFVCCDRGEGMSDLQMQQALVPFHSSKAGGAGLGLPLSLEIIDAHRGTLKLSRRKNGGTRVTCTIPGRSPHSSSF